MYRFSRLLLSGALCFGLLLSTACSESGGSSDNEDVESQDLADTPDAAGDIEDTDDQESDSSEMDGTISLPDVASPEAPAPLTAEAERPRANCPQGWTAETDEDGVEFCVGEPYEWEAPPCSGERWPETGDVANVIYVDKATQTTGTGTALSPFGTLDEAVAAANSTTDLIALAAGNYVLLGSITADLEVRGVCPAETAVTVTSGTPVGSMADVVFRALALETTDEGGVALLNGANFTILDSDIAVEVGGKNCFTMFNAALSVVDSRMDCPRGVVANSSEVMFSGVEFTTGSGPISATDTSLEVRRVSTLEAGARLLEGSVGFFLRGGTASFERSHLLEGLTSAIISIDGNLLTVSDVVILDTERVAGNESVIDVREGETSLTRVRIEGCNKHCIRTGEGNTLVVEDSIIGGNVQESDPPNAAVVLYSETSTSIRRSVIRDYGTDAISTRNTEVEVEDLTVFRGSGQGGAALRLWGTSTVSRVHLIQPEGGIVVPDPRSVAVLEDIRIEGYSDAGPREFGGVAAAVNARYVTLRRADIRGTLRTGLWVDSGGFLTASDVVIDSPVDPTGQLAAGVFLYHRIDPGVDLTGMELERIQALNSLGHSVVTYNGASLSLIDADIAGTADTSEFIARAIYFDDSDVVAERVRIREPGPIALTVAGPSATLDIRDLDIDGSCDSANCTPTEVGLSVFGGASASFKTFILQNFGSGAIDVDAISDIDLDNGHIANSPIGINFQDLDIDLDDVAENVSFQNVETLVDHIQP